MSEFIKSLNLSTYTVPLDPNKDYGTFGPKGQTWKAFGIRILHTLSFFCFLKENQSDSRSKWEQVWRPTVINLEHVEEGDYEVDEFYEHLPTDQKAKLSKSELTQAKATGLAEAINLLMEKVFNSKSIPSNDRTNKTKTPSEPPKPINPVIDKPTPPETDPGTNETKESIPEAPPEQKEEKLPEVVNKNQEPEANPEQSTENLDPNPGTLPVTDSELSEFAKTLLANSKFKSDAPLKNTELDDIRTCKDSMVSLQIEAEGTVPNLDFSNFPKLESLSITAISFSKLNLDNLPKLQHLEITLKGAKEETIEDQQAYILTQLTKLKNNSFRTIAINGCNWTNPTSSNNGQPIKSLASISTAKLDNTLYLLQGNPSDAVLTKISEWSTDTATPIDTVKTGLIQGASPKLVNCILTNPNLQKSLKNLTVHCDTSNEHAHFNFESFPSLESLKIIAPFQNFDGLALPKNPNLKKLAFHISEYTINHEDLTTNTIATRASEAIESALSNYTGSIKNLSLHSFSKEDAETLLNAINSNETLQNSIEELELFTKDTVSGLGSFACLSNLKNLQKLHIDLNEQPSMLTLQEILGNRITTSQSAYKILLKLSNLETGLKPDTFKQYINALLNKIKAQLDKEIIENDADFEESDDEGENNQITIDDITKPKKPNPTDSSNGSKGDES